MRVGGSSGEGYAPAPSKAVSVALTEVMQTACEFYRKQLRGAPNAIEYLKKRGLTGEIALRFGLGYAEHAVGDAHVVGHSEPLRMRYAQAAGPVSY